MTPEVLMKRFWSVMMEIIPGLASVPWCCLLGPALSLTTMGTAMSMDHSVAKVALPILWPMISYNHFRFWRAWNRSDREKRKKFWWWFTWRGFIMILSTIMVIYSTWTFFTWTPPVPSDTHQHSH